MHGAKISQALVCPIPAAFASANGAWIFPCSGAAYFSDLGKRSDVFNAFKRGTFPVETLPNFLHEATHHHCFDSVVGHVLLAARVAAQYAGNWRLICKSYEREDACLENIACCNNIALSASLALLHPLAEGLAMFGQCDAVPGPAPVASPMMFYTARAYLDYEQSENRFEATAAFVDAARRQPHSQFFGDLALIETKDPDYEPYWRGYAFVRALADVVNPLFDDADATLGFLCSFFFHDEGLAGNIAAMGVQALSSARGIPSVANAADYLQIRARRLLDDKAWREAAVKEYSAALLSGKHPKDCCNYLRSERARPEIDAFLLNAALENTAKLVLPTSSKNRRNFKFGSFVADRIEVSGGRGKLRCSFDDVTLEIDGMVQGFPRSAMSDDFTPVDGTPSVEFLFLDHYEPTD